MTPHPNAQYTTPAPTFSIAVLREVLQRGQRAHPCLAARMERAAQTLVLCSIAPAMAPENRGTAYWVESSSHDKEYWVCLHERGFRGDTCTCPDYEKRGGPCRHAIACRLMLACERAEARKASNVTQLPARTLTDDEPIPYILTDKALAALDGETPA